MITAENNVAQLWRFLQTLSALNWFSLLTDCGMLKIYTPRIISNQVSKNTAVHSHRPKRQCYRTHPRPHTIRLEAVWNLISRKTPKTVELSQNAKLAFLISLTSLTSKTTVEREVNLTLTHLFKFTFKREAKKKNWIDPVCGHDQSTSLHLSLALR